MKKLITLILLAFTLTTFAQRNSGFKVGYNIGWISSTVTTAMPMYEAMYEMNTLNELHFGYSWNIKLTGKFSIQTDLLYNRKGSITNAKDSYVETTPDPYAEYFEVVYSEDFECFSLPIALNYMITPNFFVEFGGEWSLAHDNAADDNFDFGLVTGFGYSTKYADISFRYIHGLTPHEEFTSTSTFEYDSNGVPISGIVTQSEYTEKFRTFQISLTVPVFKHIKKAMHRE